MSALLGKLIAAQKAEHAAARGVPLGCLARLLRALDGTHAAARPGRGASAVPGLIEPLTARELEVLALLAAGMSNQHIAGELVVALDTVKKHVTHILDKLGAANRTEATARARELGLLS
jgi:LuxR family maltose regulon positive regulatory protein